MRSLLHELVLTGGFVFLLLRLSRRSRDHVVGVAFQHRAGFAQRRLSDSYFLCALPERYHVRVYPLAQRVLDHVRRQDLLQAGERVGVAVSGGIDSVALLRLLLEVRGELGIVPSVVHFNHRLRGAESDGDEKFVASLAREHNLELYVESDDVSQHARDEGVSLETSTLSGWVGATTAALQPLDLIISDYNMPEMSGHDVAYELRRLRPETHVVMFSGGDIPEETRQLVDAVVPKTEAQRELLPTITRLCA